MNILFYFGHPAQFLFARATIRNLKQSGHTVFMLIKSKDVLEKLLQASGWDYQNILPEGRGEHTAGIIFGVLKRDWKIYRFARNRNIELMIGTDPAVAHAGKLLNIPVITTLEDDFDVIPKLAKITYPFTRHIFAPNVCRVGDRYNRKKLPYNGFMKLAYLHPDYFNPQKKFAAPGDKPYLLIRFAKLTAHHDSGIRGLDVSMIDRINQIAGDQYNVFINTEYELPDKYKKQCLLIDPTKIHHVLYFSDLFISDSQSMSVEASMLGVPSLRYSDFAGKISVLEELEHVYGLTHSVKPPAVEQLLSLVESFVNTKELRKEYQIKRQKMLDEKDDVTKLLTDLIERYPESLANYNEHQYF